MGVVTEWCCGDAGLHRLDTAVAPSHQAPDDRSQILTAQPLPVKVYQQMIRNRVEINGADAGHRDERREQSMMLCGAGAAQLEGGPFKRRFRKGGRGQSEEECRGPDNRSQHV